MRYRASIMRSALLSSTFLATLLVAVAAAAQPAQPSPDQAQPTVPGPTEPGPTQPPAQPPGPPAQPPPIDPSLGSQPGQPPQPGYPTNPPGAWNQPVQPQYGAQPPPYGPPPPGYVPQYGYGPPIGPPPPPLPPKEPGCCRAAFRFDPFDLLFRRLSFQAELAIWGPLSVEAEPSWIFGSSTENLDTTGGALQANFLVYFTGRALNGFYAKASVGFEKFKATLTDPELMITAEKDIASPILGIAVGSSNVFGEEYGFNLAGGVGVGFATAEKKTLTAGRYEVTFYDKSSVVQLLASLGLGFAF